MVDHLLFNKEAYYPLHNLGTLVGKHVHPISTQITNYVSISTDGIGRLYEDHAIGNEAITEIRLIGSGVFFSTGQSMSASVGTVFWRLSDYLNAGGRID